MTISTKRASQLRLGIRWAYRDMEARRLNVKLNAAKRGWRFPLLGETAVKEQSTATKRAYARLTMTLLVREVHGLTNRLRPHLGDETVTQIEKVLGVPKTKP